jgi:hypothetical protein
MDSYVASGVVENEDGIIVSVTDSLAGFLQEASHFEVSAEHFHLLFHILDPVGAGRNPKFTWSSVGDLLDKISSLHRFTMSFFGEDSEALHRHIKHLIRALTEILGDNHLAREYVSWDLMIMDLFIVATGSSCDKNHRVLSPFR